MQGRYREGARDRPAAGHPADPIARVEGGQLCELDDRLPGARGTTHGDHGLLTVRDEAITADHARMPEPRNRDCVAAFRYHPVLSCRD